MARALNIGTSERDDSSHCMTISTRERICTWKALTRLNFREFGKDGDEVEAWKRWQIDMPSAPEGFCMSEDFLTLGADMRTPEDANFPKLPHTFSIIGELLYFRVRICPRVRALARPRLGSCLRAKSFPDAHSVVSQSIIHKPSCP